MVVQVMSRKQFEEYGSGQHRDTSIVISISSRNEYAPCVNCNNTNKIISILPLYFNDTDNRDSAYGAMTYNDAVRIAQFIKSNYANTVDKVIVHCGAGQSRSAGVAAAILKYYTGDDSEIFDKPRYTPNMLCYRYTLEALMFN